MEQQIELKIPNNEILHVLYMCIIEHWSMPSYALELSKDEFDILVSLRKKLEPLNQQIKFLEDSPGPTFFVTKAELRVWVKAFRIGFTELGIDFSTLVGGLSESFAEKGLGFLKSYLLEYNSS